LKQFVKFFLRVVTRVGVIPCLYILSPFVILKLGILYNQRIGHIAINTEMVMRRLRLIPPARRTIILAGVFDPANETLVRMYSRVFRIFVSRQYVRYLFAVSDIFENTPFWETFPWRPEQHTRENFTILNTSEPILSFTADEMRRGAELLRQMDIGKDDWYACIHAREQSYFSKWRPELAEHWGKVKFRNIEIDAFEKAAHRITESGGNAIRVGALTDRVLGGRDETRMIDYAGKFRSDFGDVYLLSHCRFFLCSNSGLNMVSTIFNRPIGIANAIPLNSYPFHTYDLFIPGFVVSKENGEPVPFPVLQDMGFFAGGANLLTYSERLHAEGLKPVGNSAEDIDDLCADLLEIANGNSFCVNAVEEQDAYHAKYFDFLEPGTQVGKISPRFLYKYRHLIFPDTC